MNKLLAVFKREYIQAVRKKMFIIMTFLLPLLMAALFFLPGLLLSKGLGEKKIAVLDGTGQLRDTFAHRDDAPKTPKPLRGRDIPSDIKIEYVARPADRAIETTARAYLDRMADPDKTRQLDGVFIIPFDALTMKTEAHMKFYSRSATDFITQERLSSI